MGGRPAIVCHSCNSSGKWGKGFVLAVSNRWKEPEAEYRKLQVPIQKGFVQFVPVAPGVTVANMIGQGDPQEEVPVDYDALRKALGIVRQKAMEIGAAVHMPRIGAGLGRGDWNKIQKIVEQEVSSHGLDVMVYDSPKTHVRVAGNLFRQGN